MDQFSVHTGESVRRQHIKQLALVKAHVLRRLHFRQQFIHQHTTTRWSNRRRIRVVLANHDIGQVRWIERTQVFNLNVGPTLNCAFQELRVFQLRIVAQDRNLYSALACHCINRHFVSARMIHFELFVELAFGLHPNHRIKISTR